MRGLTTQARPTLLHHPLARDIAVVAVWFVVAGVLGALVWWQVTPLAEFTRTATNAEMGEDQLGRQVSADGWFFVISAAGGLVSGVALLLLRRRDPVAMVVLVTLGGLLGTWLMLHVGLWLGPPDPKDALTHVAVGGKVPLQLRTSADGLVYVWSLGALLGAVGVLWGSEEKRFDLDGRQAHLARMPATSPYGETVRRLVAESRFRPVRLREGYDGAAVDRLLERVVETALRGDDVTALVDHTDLARVRFREAYDVAEVDRLLARIKSESSSSITG